MTMCTDRCHLTVTMDTLESNRLVGFYAAEKRRDKRENTTNSESAIFIGWL